MEGGALLLHHQINCPRKNCKKIYELQSTFNKLIARFCSWGFCNDANEIPSAECITGTTAHKYFEVETTLLPNEVCNIRSTALTTKQCTGYVPHKPSIYDFTYDNETGFELNGYLGGYYRDFVPKTQRRRSRIRYDFDVSKL